MTYEVLNGLTMIKFWYMLKTNKSNSLSNESFERGGMLITLKIHNLECV